MIINIVSQIINKYKEKDVYKRQPSYLVKAGDVISVREIRKDNKAIQANVEENASRPVPAWLEKDAEKLSGKVVRLAAREDVDLPVEEHLIVELYSK